MTCQLYSNKFCSQASAILPALQETCRTTIWVQLVFYHFLEKNYKKAEEIFKKLYTIEEKQSQKDEYASYLARANALLNNSDSAIFYAREIKDKKIFQKTFG